MAFAIDEQVLEAGQAPGERLLQPGRPVEEIGELRGDAPAAGRLRKDER
jgi:hypothetical protein